jgi:hypothetical protein
MGWVEEVKCLLTLKFIEMKKIKKNLFGIGLALAMIMGIGFSFIPQSVNAEPGQGEGCRWDGYKTIKPNENGVWAMLCNCETFLGDPGDECSHPGS